MPGSVPTETYAATVAARRTSGAASTCSAIARAGRADLGERPPVAGGEQLVAQRELGGGAGRRADVRERIAVGHPASLRSKHG